MRPLFEPDYQHAGFVRRWWNRLCDWLMVVALSLHEGATAHLRAELDEGYREIAEHAAKVRARYPDDYAAADAELRLRHTHLGLEDEGK